MVTYPLASLGRCVRRIAVCATVAVSLFGGDLRADVLIRWDQNQIPSPASLALASVVVPAVNAVAVRSALGQGYRVYLEVEGAAALRLAGGVEGIAGVVVRGDASPKQIALLERRLPARARIITLDERGKWPHIRTNWVTRNNDVLQVSGRSAQPWIENNAALLRIAQAAASPTSAKAFAGGRTVPWISYPWQPITLAEIDDGPQIENYLVAIAEAGLFGGDLLLPLHPRFQQDLLLGLPQARAGWDRIRRHIEFYSWNLPGRYRPITNIGVLAADPMSGFEILNLLSRHNLPFELIALSGVSPSSLGAFDLVLALDPPPAAHLDVLAAFAASGGTVVIAATGSTPAPEVSARPSASAEPPARPWGALPPVLRTDERVSYQVGAGRVVEVLRGIADPNLFAFEIRQLLGPEHRVLDIWNGITVIAAPYRDPDGRSVLVSVLNYSHQPLPVQLRIAGTFSLVQYESPEEPPALLPYQHRDGYTEVVLPALSIGGRLFLNQRP